MLAILSGTPARLCDQLRQDMISVPNTEISLHPARRVPALTGLFSLRLLRLDDGDQAMRAPCSYGTVRGPAWAHGALFPASGTPRVEFFAKGQSGCQQCAGRPDRRNSKTRNRRSSLSPKLWLAAKSNQFHSNWYVLPYIGDKFASKKFREKSINLILILAQIAPSLPPYRSILLNDVERTGTNICDLFRENAFSTSACVV
ncbi:hypothetical protein [Rhizobium giardinii]|uniref:Uncharacterized protein n=1 Tax=Rhizobium giardinii TaxID=56731 RepID=A0A7W8X8Z7_9HYPH|nr:hypothetical protein [Rhizobium giardinii]MBB5535038.1 hypothetical protein [Rhizobium giardinii]